MQYVHRMCYEEITEECSKLGHKSINKDYEKTMDCVKASFEGTNFSKDDNKLLKADTESWKAYGSAYWPAVVINDRTYRGDLIPDNVLNAICASFTTEPDYCKKFKQEEGMVGEPEGITGNVLIAVVVLLVIVNIVLILIYRKCTNKELK